MFTTAEVTAYVIARSQGSDVFVPTLGEDFAGRLVGDGLPALDALDARGHRRSRCLGHLLRRASEMADIQVRGAARFPLQVKGLLQEVFALRALRHELADSTFAGDGATSSSASTASW